MSMVTFSRRLARLEKTELRAKQHEMNRLLRLATDEELDEMCAIVENHEAKYLSDLPPKQARQYGAILRRLFERRDGSNDSDAMPSF
jgi:hypothetical protein